MSARTDNEALQARMAAQGIHASLDQVNTLRRAEKTLHRWYEQECGDGDQWKSWAIVRDEETGKPYMYISPHDGEARRENIPDREEGARRRVQRTCQDLRCAFYVQTDPRGAALYVAPPKAEIHASNYSSVGICCAV